MSENLPIAHPAEAIEISPEALEIANCYLITPDIAKVAQELDTTPDVVTKILNRREVRAYVDNVFFNAGFNNRFKMRQALDAIIEKKFQEMDEADIGSNKDILEILTLSHKFTKELLELEIKKLALEKGADAKEIKTQNNIQINGDGSNYASLVERLLNPDARTL